MEELKPCPFCGKKKLEIKKSTLCWVYCPNCGAVGPGWFKDEDKAIEAWNRRVSYERSLGV